MMTAPVLRAPRGPRRGGTFTGAGALAKLALRRDRLMLPVWVYVVVIGVASNAYAFAKLYKTAAARESLVSSGLDNPALIFLYGRLNGDSVGALTACARAARGLGIGVLGVAFLARAVGDATGASGPTWLTWALPLGWTEALRPFAGERWWVLALPVALFAGCAALAFSLAQRRD